MAARSTVNLEISGGAVDFTLADLEKFVHDARDLGLPVNANVHLSFSGAGGDPRERDMFTLSCSGPRSSAGEERDRLSTLARQRGEQ